MAAEDDFTFCQVGAPVDGDDAQKIADDISEIHVDDRNANAANTSNKNGGGIWNSIFSRKQETVGSLSFNVIDASSLKEVNQRPKKAEQEGDQRPKQAEQEVDQRPKQAEQEVAGSSNKATPEIKTPVRKPKARAKVPYEKGYSQMDWLKLTRTHPDLAGLKGQSNKRLIKMSEVKQHQSEDSMWTVLKGRVYNITPYMNFHPGGVDKLMKAVGKDCTFLFNKYHAWVNAEFMLEKCLVGILDESK